MTAPKRLTRRLFWRHWPEVAPGFAIGKFSLMRDGSGHCPLTAVAARVGFPVRDSADVGAVLLRPYSRKYEYPAWANDVIAAADGSTDRPAYRRLVEHIPEGNR